MNISGRELTEDESRRVVREISKIIKKQMVTNVEAKVEEMFERIDGIKISGGDSLKIVYEVQLPYQLIINFINGLQDESFKLAFDLINHGGKVIKKREVKIN